MGGKEDASAFEIQSSIQRETFKCREDESSIVDGVHHYWFFVTFECTHYVDCLRLLYMFSVLLSRLYNQILLLKFSRLNKGISFFYFQWRIISVLLFVLMNTL